MLYLYIIVEILSILTLYKQPPAGINLLGLTGSVDSTFKSISGSTINQNCGTFNLRRTATGMNIYILQIRGK